MRPGHRGARGQQQQRIQQRQMPGIEGLDALGRPDAAEQRVAGGVHGIAGEQRRIEEGPEPGDEEHHLGGDEQDHAVAVADLHHAGVVALVLRLADHVRPPARHGVEHADDADAENDRRRREQMMHPGDRADRHDEGRDRADDRPRARIDEVVVVVLDLRRSHCGLSVSGAGVFGTYSSQKSNPGIAIRDARDQRFPLRLSGSPRRQRLRRRIAHGIERIGQGDGVQPVIVAVLRPSTDRHRTPPASGAFRPAPWSAR